MGHRAWCVGVDVSDKPYPNWLLAQSLDPRNEVIESKGTRKEGANDGKEFTSGCEACALPDSGRGYLGARRVRCRTQGEDIWVRDGSVWVCSDST